MERCRLEKCQIFYPENLSLNIDWLFSGKIHRDVGRAELDAQVKP